MCGRARLVDDVSEIKQDLHIEWDRIEDYQPRWNAPPTSDMPVVTSHDGKRSLELMRWGLIPPWARDIKIGASTYNARADSIETKPAFRGAWLAGRRCLVVADCYFEWRRSDKQPFAIALGNRGPMVFAGLWDVWRAGDGAHVKSFAIVTTEANDFLAPVHDRMPVILAADCWPAWLGETPATREELKALLRPYPSERMTLWPVDRAIGNARNDRRELSEPAAEAEAPNLFSL